MLFTACTRSVPADTQSFTEDTKDECTNTTRDYTKNCDAFNTNEGYKNR